MNQCLIALAYDQHVRIYVANTTALVKKAALIHQTLPTASAALGRFLTASLMMSLMYKEKERLKLKITGNGPIEEMIVEVKRGVGRAYIKNPGVYLVKETGPNQGKLDVGQAIGQGFLHVTKDYNQNFFTSTSPLTTGEIGDDFTYFFTVSEQTPSAVGLGVLVGGTKAVVKQAGGFIIQLLPSCPESVITTIEGIIKDMPAITTLLEKGLSLEALLALLSNNTHQILESHPLKYHCGCSKRYYQKILTTLDVDTLTQFKDEDHGAEIICQYCLKKYQFTPDDLEGIIETKKKKDR